MCLPKTFLLIPNIHIGYLAKYEKILKAAEKDSFYSIPEDNIRTKIFKNDISKWTKYSFKVWTLLFLNLGTLMKIVQFENGLGFKFSLSK